MCIYRLTCSAARFLDRPAAREPATLPSTVLMPVSGRRKFAWKSPMLDCVTGAAALMFENGNVITFRHVITSKRYVSITHTTRSHVIIVLPRVSASQSKIIAPFPSVPDGRCL